MQGETVQRSEHIYSLEKDIYKKQEGLPAECF